MAIDATLSPEQIREMYLTKRKSRSLSVMLMGEFSSGKTRFLGTAPRPILIDSFDPNGTAVLEDVYMKDIEAGNILIRTFWKENHESPTEYRKWGRQWDSDVKNRFFDKIGTYAIDSSTTFVDALGNEIAKHNKLGPGELEIGDYKTLYNTMKMHVKMMSDFDCHFILTAHLMPEKDSLTGELKMVLDTYGKLRSQLPLLFTEKYVLRRKSKDDVKILTAPKGMYRAGTQMSSKLDGEEEPNFKSILKKAGFPYEDKPSLF